MKSTGTGDPFSTGGEALLHRRWVFDFNDDAVGGFATGEFLLCNNGALFIRYGGDVWAGGSTFYRFSPWEKDQRWRGTSVTEFAEWAADYGYGLHPPSTVPIDETET